MNRLQVENLIGRVRQALKKEADERFHRSHRVQALQRQYDQVQRELAPLRARAREIERKVLDLGGRIATHGEHENKIRVDWYNEAQLSRRQRRLQTLVDELRIARMGRTPEDIAKAQRLLRRITAMAPAPVENG